MRRCYLVMLLALIAMTAIAAPLTQGVNFSYDPIRGNEIISPDRAQPDTIYYDNAIVSSLNVGTNYYSAVRFTPTGNFRIRSVYFAILNQYNNTTAPCSVFVYSDTNVVGTGHRPNVQYPSMNIRVPPPVACVSFTTPLQGWIDRDFPDTILVNTDFWVVYGPMPGGAYPGTTGSGFWNISDAIASPDNRSILFTGARTANMSATAPTYITGHSLLCRVGGAYQNAVDMSVDSIYSFNANNNERRFFYPYLTPVKYAATVTNRSSNSVSNYSVVISVIDTAVSPTDTVFQQRFTTGLPTLARNASTTVTTTIADTMPNFENSFIVTARAFLTGDGDLSNNSKMLECKTNNLNTWYKYQLSANNALTFSGFTEYGAAFIPTRYPARLDSIALAVGGSTTAQNDTLFIYLQPDLSLPFSTTPVRTYVVNVPTGNNIITRRIDTLTIYQGAVAVVLQGQNGQLGLSETTPPIAGTNQSMPTVSVRNQGAGPVRDNSGDWAIQAHFVTAGGLPPYPVLRARPVPNDTIRFDTTAVGTPNSKTLWICNDGGVAMQVTRVSVNPGVNRQWITIPAADTAFTVASLDSHLVHITWTPPDNTPLACGLDLYVQATLTASWRMKGIVRGTSVSEETSSLPKNFALLANVPNPFNPVTLVRFAIPRTSNVRISVIDVMGREVATLTNGSYTAGYHSVTFDGAKFASGVYFYRMEAGSFQDIRKMMLLK